MSVVNPIIVDPRNEANSTLIWMHGLGASADDFVPMTESVSLPTDIQLRFVFPNAPAIPISINNGMTMPAWYDIYGLTENDPIDTEGLQKSCDAIHRLIDEQINSGIDSRRIVIGGFSQGGAVAYQAALSYPKPLAGLITASSYFAGAMSLQLHPANTQLPIQIFHGVQDDVLPERMGHIAQQILQSMGFNPQYTTYPITHCMCVEEFLVIKQHLQNWLSIPHA